MKRLFSVLGALAFFAGCEAEPMRFDDPSKITDQIQYVKDKAGNCFAIVGIRGTGNSSMQGIGMAFVPEAQCPARTR